MTVLVAHLKQEAIHMPSFHGFSPRSGDLPLEAGQDTPTGKFGRMFPHLPPFRPGRSALQKLGDAMFSEDASGDNESIPAGYTYLGQFIDHDITFDPTSLQETIVDPLANRNFRTPSLDLDSIYGGGPKLQPYLYQRAAINETPKLFAIGSTRPREFKTLPLIPAFPNDLPRFSTGFALIGDPRNDENLITAQLHLAFLKFHNKVVEELQNNRIKLEFEDLADNIFEAARRIVIWHYQWIVLHDFLPRIIDNQQLEIVLQGRSFYQFTKEPFIPVEFSVAVFRLGHSMIQKQYNYNSKFEAAQLRDLFIFTGVSSSNNSDKKTVPIPSNWIIDWQRFFQIDDNIKPNWSRKINPYLINPLQTLDLPDPPISLAVRNLMRGWSVGLPSGQSVARCMGFQPLTEEQIATKPDGEIAREHGFHIASPLWYYILKEAQIQQEGQCLGEVGSRILAEVFVGVLRGDNQSFMVQHPNWTPTLPAKVPGTFTMSDLLMFVDDINPLGKLA